MLPKSVDNIHVENKV